MILLRKVFITGIIFSICLSVQGQNLQWKSEIKNDSVYYHLVNTFYAPFEITIKNKKPEIEGKFIYNKQFVVQKRSTYSSAIKIPLNLARDTVNFDFSQVLSTYSVLGDPNKAKHDDNYRYSFPFSKGKFYKVTQSFNGKKSHFSKKSKYAIDFNLKIGDTVFAAREGIVAWVIEDFKQHGGIEMIKKANKIVILHEDGTNASYVHLDYKGSLVNPGDIIKKGQPIGISGLTGYTSGPHLHFVVREARDKAVPIYFEGYEGKILKKRKKYKRL